MKKLLLFSLLCLPVLETPAQNYLTNGQVYNFNVGDIFEQEDYVLPYGNEPPIYYLTIITGKSYSRDSATIYYTESNDTYELNCMFCSWTITSSVNSMSVTNLNSPAPQANMGNTCPLKDTVYYDSNNYCGRKVWEEYPDPACLDTGFEDVTTYSWLVEGCGGAYLNYFDPSCICGDAAQLIYYKKVSDSCGNPFIVNGVDQPVSKNIPITLYPNPSSSCLNISTTGNIYWYDIMDMSGRVLISASFPEDHLVNIENLSKGFYMIGLYAKDYGRISKEFVKE